MLKYKYKFLNIKVKNQNRPEISGMPDPIHQ